MARYSRDPDDLAYGARFERDLDISDEREPFRARVALKRVTTSPADQLDALRNRFTRELPTTGGDE